MRGSNNVPVVQAGPDLADRAAGVIARSFADLPAAQWLVPDPDIREAILRPQYRIWVDHAVLVGNVDLLEDGSAVAVWFDRTRHLPDPDDYSSRLRRVCGRHTERFVVLDDLLARHHPPFAHAHLAFLAVLPQLQGTGRARMLLAPRHAGQDRSGMPAYLEAASAANVGFYRRHGYEALAPFHLPGGPPFWPMIRRPRTRPVKAR
jgi:ribosomal protein S18 acetylase RimI-like enzyme